jgi:predicted nuclease of predicted toxin-antitoxin system
MKLLVDMNLSPRWIDVLADAGIEAEHWSRIGPANAPDADLFAYAAREGAVIFTHDLDFGAILAATGARGPSVVQLRGNDLDPASAGASVLAAFRQCEQELMAGALLTVDAARFRVTLLPLTR